MIPDRFQYFLDDFWNFANFIKSWTYSWSNLDPWSPYLWFLLYQNTSINIRKYVGTSLKHIIVVYLDFKKMSNLEKTGTGK